jgi:hypothetical protein
LDCLPENGTNRLPQNIDNYHSNLPNISRRARISLMLQKPEIMHLIAVAGKRLL